MLNIFHDKPVGILEGNPVYALVVRGPLEKCPLNKKWHMWHGFGPLEELSHGVSISLNFTDLDNITYMPDQHLAILE